MYEILHDSEPVMYPLILPTIDTDLNVLDAAHTMVSASQRQISLPHLPPLYIGPERYDAYTTQDNLPLPYDLGGCLEEQQYLYAEAHSPVSHKFVGDLSNYRQTGVVPQPVYGADGRYLFHASPSPPEDSPSSEEAESPTSTHGSYYGQMQNGWNPPVEYENHAPPSSFSQPTSYQRYPYAEEEHHSYLQPRRSSSPPFQEIVEIQQTNSSYPLANPAFYGSVILPPIGEYTYSQSPRYVDPSQVGGLGEGFGDVAPTREFNEAAAAVPFAFGSDYLSPLSESPSPVIATRTRNGGREQAWRSSVRRKAVDYEPDEEYEDYGSRSNKRRRVHPDDGEYVASDEDQAPSSYRSVSYFSEASSPVLSPRRKTGLRQTSSVPGPMPAVHKKSRGRKVPHKVTQPTTESRGPAVPIPGTEAAKGRTFQCLVPTCMKTFIRGEHLKRHTRSIHMLEKPHFCPYKGCNKSFSRKDNLAQHTTIHK